jgi:hypothetical protein
METQEIPGTTLEVKPTETPELIAALCKAQAKFKPALKDADNPFFKSKYADLNAVWDACKEGLHENGLFVSQQLNTLQDKTWLRTRVYHSSGGYIESNVLVVVTKLNDPQSFGSATTYFRRYALAAILGIVTDDDDAEGAMSRSNTNAQPTASNAPTKVTDAKVVAQALKVVENTNTLDALATVWNNHKDLHTTEAFKQGVSNRKAQLQKEVSHAS